MADDTEEQDNREAIGTQAMTNKQEGGSDILLPCPFCGGAARSAWAFIACTKCLARMEGSYGEEHAIAAWNRRAKQEGVARPEAEWHEDIGPVLWWRFPIEEAPWVGEPTWEDWIDNYYTHWTPLTLPKQEGDK